jgi:drug/metabolite transporter (DMT)-like permease
MSVIWGTPYLLIKVAVDEVEPSVIVAVRSGIAALGLVPLAVMAGALRPAMARWPTVLAYAALEMAVPWLLLTNAERRLDSSLAGLLIATVPLVAAVVAALLGDRSVLAPSRLAGLAIGIAGVAIVVGVRGDETVDAWGVVAVLLVAVGYGTAPFVVTRRLPGVPSLGVNALALTAVAVLYLPFAIVQRPSSAPSAEAVWSLAGLGVLCTAIAFVLFFALIAEVGPERAPLITFVNPVVAVTLGVVLLDESVTPGLVLGFPVVLVGCWLASGGRRQTGRVAVTEAPVGSMTA